MNFIINHFRFSIFISFTKDQICLEHYLKLAAEGTRKLFLDRDFDEEATWTIETKSGDKFKFHPSILVYKASCVCVCVSVCHT